MKQSFLEWCSYHRAVEKLFVTVMFALIVSFVATVTIFPLWAQFTKPAQCAAYRVTEEPTVRWINGAPRRTTNRDAYCERYVPTQDIGS